MKAKKDKHLDGPGKSEDAPGHSGGLPPGQAKKLDDRMGDRGRDNPGGPPKADKPGKPDNPGGKNKGERPGKDKGGDKGQGQNKGGGNGKGNGGGNGGGKGKGKP
jgi:hypothetical protein